jgi:uncharacterized membrane protein YeaQ/YmgE (transglycosylase-associated protein family)
MKIEKQHYHKLHEFISLHGVMATTAMIGITIYVIAHFKALILTELDYTKAEATLAILGILVSVYGAMITHELLHALPLKIFKTDYSLKKRFGVFPVAIHVEKGTELPLTIFLTTALFPAFCGAVILGVFLYLFQSPIMTSQEYLFYLVALSYPMFILIPSQGDFYMTLRVLTQKGSRVRWTGRSYERI